MKRFVPVAALSLTLFVIGAVLMGTAQALIGTAQAEVVVNENEPIDCSAILLAARESTDAGRYAEALEKHVWSLITR